MQHAAGGEHPPLERGAFVGKYRIDGLVASSRFSRVYRAEHRLLGIGAVIKVATANSSDRIRHEAKVLAAIDSPYVPSVLEVGTLSEKYDHAACITMERIPGTSLRQLLRRIRRLNPTQALRMGLDASAALTACHERGVVHGDIKPENIVVADEGERLALVDFGSALDTRAPDQVQVRLKVTATPEYAAPEVRAGNAPTVASDVYSLACVLYEALSGNTLASQRDGNSVRPLYEVVPTSASLSEVLSLALQSEPQLRPRSAKQFAEMLAGTGRQELDDYFGFDAEGSVVAQEGLDTLEMAEVSASAPPEAMPSRPWKGDLAELLSVQPPCVWVFSGDPGTDQQHVIQAVRSLPEHFRVELLDADARGRKHIELLSGASHPWVVVFGDLHVLLGEPLLDEARRQGETSRLLISTHANWELLETSVNACGLHAQVCLPQPVASIRQTIEDMAQRSFGLRRRYDTLRLALRDTQQDLRTLQSGSR